MSTAATIDPDEMDPTHSTIEFARIDGKEVSDPNWNKLLCLIVEEYYSNLVNNEKKSREEAINIIGETVNVRDGDNSGAQGWAYSRNAKLSIQGEDSIDIWRELKTLATHLAMHRWRQYIIELELRWSVKAGGAAKIGRGRVTWKSLEL